MLELTNEYEKIGHDKTDWKNLLAQSGMISPEQKSLLNPVTGPFRAIGRKALGVLANGGGDRPGGKSFYR